VVRKGHMWHVRFYVDEPGDERRHRKSLPVGPAEGRHKLTRAQAAHKAVEIVEAAGVNTEAHLMRALHPESVETFRKRVEWCREYHKAWTDGKPGPVATMETHLSKHILPRFGDLTVDAIDERKVQEFVADLKRATFERKKKDGSIIKTYSLSRKSILNIVGVVKLVLGRKVWMTWSLDLGKPNRPKQPYFTEEQLRQIIDGAGPYRVLFAVLAGTGMRIGEAAGLHVEDLDFEHGVIQIRRAVWRGIELEPKTENAVREIDIDPTLVSLLKEHIGDRTTGRVFEARNGAPLAAGNIRNRVLTPLLKKLDIPKAGLHAFRHSRVTMLRKNGTPEDLQRLWIGHSSLRTTDRYSHTHQELEYRRKQARGVGIDLVLGPNGPKSGRQGTEKKSA